MKTEAYFKDVCELGNLYLTHVLLEFESDPILFVCEDEHKKLYLCLCCEIRSFQKWIVTGVNVETLVQLLQQEIDVFQAFEKNSIYKYELMLKCDGAELCQKVKFTDMDELDLPQKGTFLKYMAPGAKEYLTELLNVYIETHYYNQLSLPYKSITQVLPNFHSKYVGGSYEVTVKDIETTFQFNRTPQSELALSTCQQTTKIEMADVANLITAA